MISQQTKCSPSFGVRPHRLIFFLVSHLLLLQCIIHMQYVCYLYIIFILLLCNRSYKVDVLIASLVFDVVCVDVGQLEVEKQTIFIVLCHKVFTFCYYCFVIFDVKVMMTRALRWLKPEGLMIVQVKVFKDWK